MHDKSIRELSQALKNKEFSSTELTTHYLKRINQYSEFNAFISIDEQHAMDSAKAADDCLKRGKAHILTGIPLAHKDIFCTEQSTTTCGSKMLANYKSPYAATVVQQLGAVNTVTLGKTNMDEFGMGSGNQNSYFGPVKNPWDITRVPGGSSGGSAAAVSASLVPFATGSDTGGSIRQPAAFCGVSGIKPTYGLASRFGMVAFASSLDQAGPIARSVDDLALILQVMAGFDEKDSTSINKPLPDFTSRYNQSLLPLRIGLPSGFFQSEVNEDIQKAVKSALKIYEAAGTEIIDIELPLQKLWVPCYYMIACAESSSNLSRYDGVRYGHRAFKSKNIQDLITQSRDEGFGMEVKRRILAGTYILSAGHFEDHYIQAQKIRRMIQDELLSALTKVDVILGPTTPSCAFKIDNKLSDPTEAYLADILTVAANLAGLPALSIPVGFNPEGLPIGMQMMGNHFSEEQLLAIGHFYQQHTDWHTLRPEAFK